MLPPNIENYTIPGGIKFFFDDGTGERDLGNVVSIDMTPGTDELEHYTNRSGKRMKDYSLTIEEKLTIKLTLDEIVAEHLKYFFKGGDISNVTAGTGSVVDQAITLTGSDFISVGNYYGLSAVSLKNHSGVTKTQNEDYVVDYGSAGVDGRRVGRIARLAGGTITDGEVCTVSFTYTTWASQQFSIAGAEGFITGACRIEMHPASGRGTRIDLEIPKCQIKPEGNIMLDDKDWKKIPLTIEVLDNTALTPTYPMGRLLVYEN